VLVFAKRVALSRLLRNWGFEKRPVMVVMVEKVNEKRYEELQREDSEVGNFRAYSLSSGALAVLVLS
jgi:hypothetical protein